MTARRLFAGLLEAIAFVVVALSATILGLVVHANLPAAKRIARASAESMIASTIAGHVVVERLDRLGALSADGVDLEVRDPEGTVVLRAEGVAARLDAAALLASLFRSRGSVIRFSRLEVTRLFVVVAEDPRGGLTLSRALASRSAGGGERTS